MDGMIAVKEGGEPAHSRFPQCPFRDRDDRLYFLVVMAIATGARQGEFARDRPRGARRASAGSRSDLGTLSVWRLDEVRRIL